jgi:hypothetical protein
VRKSNGNLAANGTLYWSMTPEVVAETDLAGTTKASTSFLKASAWPAVMAQPDPKTGKTIKPDAVTKTGKPVELKPRTKSGRAAGKSQLPKYERTTGKKGRIVYYDKGKN